ncbi:MAG: urea ABC transporter permease subunit UrtB [Opitutaceae bacterium]|nr:urea ABC transporter permease subunit UrtB [Opitutaceae bacterium]
MKPLPSVLGFLFSAWLACSAIAAGAARLTIAKAILTEDDTPKRALVAGLAGEGDEDVPALLAAWRSDQLFIHAAADGAKVPVQLIGPKDAAEAQEALRVDTGEPLRDASGKPLRLVAADLTAVEHDAALRRAMKSVLDVAEIAARDPAKRRQAIQAIGFAQNADKLPALEARLAIEREPKVRLALREALAVIRLKDSSDDAKLAALRELRELEALSSYDLIQAALKNAGAAGQKEIAAACRATLAAIDRHRSSVDFFGTLFRSASLGSILLIVALGLAITFGLMGVINMAHGEMIAVGAYTTYLTQSVFGGGVTIPCFGLSLAIPGMHLGGWVYQAYFLAAIPASFLAAALVGIGLERGIIRFLYRRPLESLLATWGVSLLLQQTFRLTFGANNVQVSSPAYLSGNWTVNDIILGWNRVFVIGFALLIVFGVWLVLTRTPLGLLIRAVMQNRTMAACMGVRTERVNMLTFGLGSGLAGLAGAFLSQIGNVGPSLGQSYIVDAFMTVVVGGVGNLMGTVISAFGIGGLDQVLQQYLPTWAPGLAGFPLIGSFLQNLAQDSSVFGKILVLALIVLFLQWRPAGLFVTRSRSLD